MKTLIKLTNAFNGTCGEIDEAGVGDVELTGTASTDGIQGGSGGVDGRRSQRRILHFFHDLLLQFLKHDSSLFREIVQGVKDSPD